MIKAHFDAKLAAVKDRVLLLEMVTVPQPYQEKITALKAVCENEQAPSADRVTSLHRLTETIDEAEQHIAMEQE